MKPNTEKNASLLKKALLTTLVVAVPGGTLIGLAWLIAKKRKAKKENAEPPAA